MHFFIYKFFAYCGVVSDSNQGIRFFAQGGIHCFKEFFAQRPFTILKEWWDQITYFNFEKKYGPLLWIKMYSEIGHLDSIVIIFKAYNNQNLLPYRRLKSVGIFWLQKSLETYLQDLELFFICSSHYIISKVSQKEWMNYKTPFSPKSYP